LMACFQVAIGGEIDLAKPCTTHQKGWRVEPVEKCLDWAFPYRNDSMNVLIRLLKFPSRFRRSSIFRME